jgi:ribosomal-protein-alanine N-acetyltransferase
VTVRRATVADVPAIAGLELDNLERDAWSENLVQQGVEGTVPTIHYWVAEVDGVVVGHAVASILADIAELQRISVTDEHRRQAHATALLDAVVREATDQGADRVLLEVREGNHPALAFYARHGFTEIDRRRGYYSDGTTAIILLRSLADAHADDGDGDLTR